MCEGKSEQKDALCYVRAFSDLGEYQQAYTVTYRLRRQAFFWEIEIVQSGQCVQTDRMQLRMQEEQAVQLLTLLYENAVSIALWRDVIENLSIACVMA